MRKWIWYCLLIVGAFCLGLADAPLYAFVILYVGILLSIFWIVFYPFFFLRDRERLERYMRNQPKNSILYFLYTVVNSMHDEIEVSYHIVMKKRLNPSKKAIYQVIYGFSKKEKDLEFIKQQIESIKLPEWKAYYKTLLLLEENEVDKAKEVMDSMRNQKLKSILEAELLVKENKREEAKKLLSNLISHSRGYRYYILLKRYDEIFLSK